MRPSKLDDYDGMFRGVTLAFPHRMVISFVGDCSISKIVDDDRQHREEYFLALKRVREHLGMFNPIVIVRSSQCRSITEFEVIPPREILEEMQSLQ